MEVNFRESNITLIESFCMDYEHTPFAKNIIKRINEEEPKSLNFIGDSAYKINFNSFDTKQHLKVIRSGSFILRALRGIILFLNICRGLDSKTKNILVDLTFTFPKVFSYFLCSLFFRDVHIVVYAHAELSQVNSGSFVGRYLKRKLLGMVARKNVKIVVLGESIYNNFLSIDKSYSRILSWIHHPYSYNEFCLDRRVRPRKGERYNIGFLGVANEDKGVENLLRFAKYNYDQKLKQNIFVIGKVPSRINKEALLSYGVEVPFDGMVDKSAMDDMAVEMDCFIFLLSSTAYKLRASGTFFDAINYEKPIFSLENDFFNYYLSIDNNIGECFSSVDELCNFFSSGKINFSSYSSKFLKHRLSTDKSLH